MQADGELSGLPTPDSTPKLRRPLQRPYESNHNCNNTAEAPPSRAFMAVVGNTVAQQVFPISHHHSNSFSNGSAHKAGASCTSLHLLEENNTSGGGGAADGGGGVPQKPLPQQQQPLPHAVVDVSALDELLKHIQEVSASGTGGIKVLTSTSSSSLLPGPSSSSAAHHHHHPPHPQQHLQGHTRTHQYNHSHHRSNQQAEADPCFSFPAHNSSSSSSSVPEKPATSGTRRPSQRHPLIKMGGAVPRQRSFLARMNTNSSCNRPPAGGGGGEGRGLVSASSCLTRQHSYSGGPHAPRAPIVRRTVSLKPKVPPKPLFLPNTPTEAGRVGY